MRRLRPGSITTERVRRAGSTNGTGPLLPGRASKQLLPVYRRRRPVCSGFACLHPVERDLARSALSEQSCRNVKRCDVELPCVLTHAPAARLVPLSCGTSGGGVAGCCLVCRHLDFSLAPGSPVRLCHRCSKSERHDSRSKSPLRNPVSIAAMKNGSRNFRPAKASTRARPPHRIESL